MAVELISEIVQKGGQDFALVDANNIRGGKQFYHIKKVLRQKKKEWYALFRTQ